MTFVFGKGGVKLSNLSDYWAGYRAAKIYLYIEGLNAAEIESFNFDANMPYGYGFQKGLAACRKELKALMDKDAQIHREQSDREG